MRGRVRVRARVCAGDEEGSSEVVRRKWYVLDFVLVLKRRLFISRMRFLGAWEAIWGTESWLEAIYILWPILVASDEVLWLSFLCVFLRFWSRDGCTEASLELSPHLQNSISDSRCNSFFICQPGLSAASIIIVVEVADCLWSGIRFGCVVASELATFHISVFEISSLWAFEILSHYPDLAVGTCIWGLFSKFLTS